MPEEIDLQPDDGELAPEAIFARRQAIITAIKYEYDLEDAALEKEEEVLEKLESRIQAVEEAIALRREIMDALESASDNMLDTLTLDQRSEVEDAIFPRP